MPNELRIDTYVEIEAPADRVWNALTDPEVIERWFFGVSTETDWAEGSPIVHRGEYRGRPYEDKGILEHVEPGRRLVHTHWSPVSGLPDEPGNYQEVSWLLDERESRTKLTVRETNLPSEEAASISEQSWKQALGALKAVVEKG